MPLNQTEDNTTTALKRRRKMTKIQEQQQQQSAPHARTRRRRIRQRNHATITPTLSSSTLILFLSIASFHPRAKAQTCDYGADSCHYQFDGECDAGVYCSANTDCFDCDVCSGFNYDCGLCIQAGCYWCPGDALCASSPIGPSLWDNHPDRQPACRLESDWTQQCTPKSTNVFSDPLYESMAWIYELIKVEEVWKDGFTGKGIHVRVNDDGVDATHNEFVVNFDEVHSCDVFLPTDYAADTHGTGCASIIAGAKDNNACAAGVSPDVVLSACNGPDSLGGATEIFNTHLSVVDVISNSWGPLPCSDKTTARRLQSQACPFDLNHPTSPCNNEDCGAGAAFSGALTPLCEEAIVAYCSTLYENDPVACGEYLDLYVTCSFHSLSIVNTEGFPKIMAEGRGGLGPIITFAGGNDYKIGVDANGDGMINSRYTIGVAAVGKDGLHASYSTVGAALLVAAPGGDDEALSNNIVAKPGGGCHDVTVGTSFATPVVSAVAALMLQANPKLGWRDVQGILAETSQRVDFEDPSWTTNQVGISHSYKYGFGLIDAAAAVAFAQVWENWDAEKQIMVESGDIDVSIPDNNSNGVSATLTITAENVLAATGTSSIAMESVVVYLDLQHGSRGDVKIVLTSPHGTKSLLAPSKRPENTVLEADERWKLMTLRSWGENPIGTWTIELADEEQGIISNCVNKVWQYEFDNTLYDCGDLDGITDCSSVSQVPPALQVGTFNDQTIFDNCCVCGGGTDAAAIDQRLQSWRLIAYGHTAPETPAPTSPAPTTPAPVTAAPVAPTPSPTPAPKVCNYQNDTQLTVDSGPLDVAIPDAGGGVVVSTMTINHPSNRTVDNVQVFLNISHPSLGDLRVVLKSGNGTDAVLAPGNRTTTPQVPNDQFWELTTCEASGESVNGDWTLSVEDTNTGNQGECVDSPWQAIVGNIAYLCSNFSSVTNCNDANQADQSAVSTVFEGRTALESCCACGGGTNVADISNMLKSWNMILFSNTKAVVTQAPTLAPTILSTPPPTLGGNVSSQVPATTSVPVPGSSVPATSAPTPQPTIRSTLAPAALQKAIVMTIAPDITNTPFRTSGTSGACGAFVAKFAILSIGVGLAVSMFSV